ncbi:Os08g0551225, partial [Oryza sativa Japonica Group]
MDVATTTIRTALVVVVVGGEMYVAAAVVVNLFDDHRVDGEGNHGGGERVVPLPQVGEAQRRGVVDVGRRRRRQRLDAAEEVVQRGGGVPQRGGVGAVGVGERVAVADGVGQQRGAVPAQRHSRAAPAPAPVSLGLAAPHGRRA